MVNLSPDYGYYYDKSSGFLNLKIDGDILSASAKDGGLAYLYYDTLTETVKYDFDKYSFVGRCHKINSAG